MKKTTYYVTLPDGRIAQRKTARYYSHAVAIRPTLSTEYMVNHAWERDHHHGKWLVVGFCGSEALAEALVQKERRYYQGIGAGVEIEILQTRGAPCCAPVSVVGTKNAQADRVRRAAARCGRKTSHEDLDAMAPGR